MQLNIEIWLSSQNISEAVEATFEEAISCYKAGAYRAALMLSYVAFLSILRDRILSTETPPGGINSSLWNNIIDGVKDDDTWESTVFDSTQRKKPDSIFDVTDDNRQQVLYWKNRRNDCAHSKRNRISNSHVEAFWQFVQSNLPKFVVRESRDSLLNLIRVHFDRSITPAGEDLSYLVEQIPDADEPDDIPAFLEEAYDIIDNAFFIALDELTDLFSRLLGLGTINAQVVNFLKTKEDLLVEILRTNPTHLLVFSGDAQFIRLLWYQYLFDRGRNDLHLYCSLLRNRLIPADQIEEAHELIIRKMPDSWPSDECFQLLEQTGFFDKFKNMVFISDKLANSFGWANFHTDMVVKYLERFGIDANIAQSLQHIFLQTNHPYDLRDALDEMFLRNMDKKNEMLQHLAEDRLPLPKYLKSLKPGDDRE